METSTHSHVHAADPMEHDEWLTALSDLSDRLESIERMQRLHAQSIAHIEEQSKQMYGHRKEAVKLNDEARVIDYTDINARVQIADDKMGKFRELDESLTEIAKQLAERDMATKNASLGSIANFKSWPEIASRQSETFDMSPPMQQSRLPEQAFPGQAFPQCNVAGPQQPQTYPNVTGQPRMYGPPIAPAGGADENYFGTCAPPTMRVEPPASPCK